MDVDSKRALSAEIVGSEQIRVSVVAAILAALLIADQLLFWFALDKLQSFIEKPLTWWLPLWVIGPLLAHEIVTLCAIRGRAARGKDLPRVLRIINVVVETSLHAGVAPIIHAPRAAMMLIAGVVAEFVRYGCAISSNVRFARQGRALA